MEVLLVPMFFEALAALLMWAVFRRGVSWSVGELFLPLLPLVAWNVVQAMFQEPTKTLTNFFLEIVGLTLLPVAYILVRGFVLRRRLAPTEHVITCAAFLVATIGVFFLTPTLSE